MSHDPLDLIAASYRGMHESTQVIAQATTRLVETQQLLAQTQLRMEATQRGLVWLQGGAIVLMGFSLLFTGDVVWQHLAWRPEIPSRAELEALRGAPFRSAWLPLPGGQSDFSQALSRRMTTRAPAVGRPALAPDSGLGRPLRHHLRHNPRRQASVSHALRR